MAGVGIIFNGGRSRRMAVKDKALLEIEHCTNLDRIQCPMMPATEQVFVSVAADFKDEVYQGLNVIKDDLTLIDNKKNSSVALALLSLMNYVKSRNMGEYIITSPSDTPLLDRDFGIKPLEVWQANSQRDNVCVWFDEQVQSLHALWPMSAWWKVEQLVIFQKIQKMSEIHRLIGSHILKRDKSGQKNPFYNINSTRDLKNIYSMIEKVGSTK